VILAVAGVCAAGAGNLAAEERKGKPYPASEPDVVVRNVRLASAPPLEESPTGVVQFDVFNQGRSDRREVTLEIAIFETPPALGDAAPLPNLLVGPFRVRTKSALKAGYSVHYELRLRNFLLACDCAATVEVVDERDAAQSPSAATFHLP
jgi:hypothetical protein